MALTSSLAADFSQFVAEAKKAEDALAGVQASAKVTETAVSSMGTAAESSANQTASSVGNLGKASKQTRSDMAGMSDGLEVADQALDALGINVGKQINDIQKLGKVSLDTSTSIGKFGTAVSVASAAMIGWEIGRKIAELTGSDKIIGDATASMLGWRDAGQAAANNADVLQRAFEKTGKVFTDVHAASEALRASSRDHAAQLATTSSAVVAWHTELQNARGGVAALKGEIDAGNLTTQQMVDRFKVSAEAIDYQRRMMALAAEETRKKAAEDEKAAAAAKAHADAVQHLQDSMFGADSIAKAQQYVEALGSTENLTRMSKDAQAAMNVELGKAIEAYTRWGQTAPQVVRDLYVATIQLPPVVEGIGQLWDQLGEKITMNADAAIAKGKELQAAAAAYEAETQRMVEQYIQGQYGAAGAADAHGKQVDETRASVEQMSVALQDFGNVAQSAYEKAIAGANLLKAYSDAGIATGGSIGLGGYDFNQLKKTGVPGGWAGVGWAQGTAPGAGQPWGTQNTLNVNVNNATADDIATKLVTEMRHNGVRL